MQTPNMVELEVEGMTCTNCAATVRRKLEKEGMKEVNVDFASGAVSFINDTAYTVVQIAEQINDLGYHTKQTDQPEKKNY